MNEPLTLSAALIAGLAGSGHCLGMCGPLAAMAGASGGKRSITSAVIQNLGRLLGYAMLGAIVGGLGMGMAALMPSAAAGPVLRGLLGLVLILLGLQLLAPRLRYNPLNLASQKLAAPLWRRLQPLALKLNARRGPGALLVRGMLWGWLPCGLVYSLLSLAAVSGSAATGAGVMLAFGLGTLPTMLGIGLLGGQLTKHKALRWRPLMGAAMIVGGIIVALMPLSHLMGGHQHQGGHSPHHEQSSMAPHH